MPCAMAPAAHSGPCALARSAGAAGGDDEEDPPLPPGHFGASSLGMDGAVQDLWVVEAGLDGWEHGGPPGW